jgi:hypothetical protein
MTRELIGGFPAVDGREQMGQFLRHAFPLGLGSFEELLVKLEEEEQAKAKRAH